MTESKPPSIPSRLSRLPELEHDLWLTWNGAREVFRRLDYALWRQSVHNPVLMLQRISAEALERGAADPGFLAAYDSAVAATDAMRTPTTPTWWQSHLGAPAQGVVAYFCAEFALHQSLPIYAGGLGVLAGDHCKEASDLGIPIVGVGFMYPQGYFRQRNSTEGWQQEHYVVALLVTLARDNAIAFPTAAPARASGGVAP